MVMRITKNYEEFDGVVTHIEETISAVANYADEGDIQELGKLIGAFKAKTDEFYRKDRRLNIGIIGQVKSGKSSFLNTFLFGGKDILPKASTPKTATLTKIEYGEDNVLMIEYYSKEDWAGIVENAQLEGSDSGIIAARELVRMANDNGIDKERCFALGTEKIAFTSDEELFNQLNNYVGEDGLYTPLVKAVTIIVHRDEFKGLSIVDTPGLNDPIQSRTLRTKEFMKFCDVVFFLSPCSSFMDISDWDLVSTQLPSEGVKRLVLIGSKFDSGIRDVLRKKTPEDDIFGQDPNVSDSIQGARDLVVKKLRKTAKEKVGAFVSDGKQRGLSNHFISVVQQIEEPLFFSSIVHTLIGKSTDTMSPEEKSVYDALSYFSDNIATDLQAIDNFSEIEAVFEQVKQEKEKILDEKAHSFIPDAMHQLESVLKECLERTETRRNILVTSDRAQIEEKKNQLEKQLNDIKADILSLFTDLLSDVETRKMEIASEARSRQSEYAGIKERTGTVTEVGYRTVSASKWWNPFSWGSTKEVSYTYERCYNYYLAADAVENISNYANDVSRQIDKTFANLVDVQGIKRRLSAVVTNNFNLSSESYDAALIKNIISETVGAIEFPIFKLDISKEIEALGSQFSGEITAADEITKLKVLMEKTFSNTVQIILNGVQTETRVFKNGLSDSGKRVQQQLIQNLVDEFNKLQADYDNQTEVLKRYEAYEEVLQKEIRRALM